MQPHRYRAIVALAALGAAACAASPALADVSFSDPVVHQVGGTVGQMKAVPSAVGNERATLGFISSGPPAELVMVHTDASGAITATERAPLPEAASHAFTLADLDGDGSPEALVAPNDASALAVYRRQGDALQRGPDISVGTDVGAPAVGDLNGDGHIDLVAVIEDSPLTGSSVVRLLGDGAGGFGPPQPIVNAQALGVLLVTGRELADLDRDGDLDLVVTGYSPTPSSQRGPVNALLNDGTGAFGPPSFLAGPSLPGKVGDVTGDGRVDLVLPGLKTLPGSFGKPPSDPFAAWIFPGNGTGGITSGPTVGDTGTMLIDVVQLDGVGPEDIIIRAVPEFGAPAPGTFMVPGLDGESFGAPVPVPGFSAVVDLNGDGANDLVQAGPGAGAISFLFAQAATAGALDFGEVPAGTSVERSLEVRNNGAAPLPLGAASIAGPAADDFALVEESCADKVLLAGQSCTVRVRFRPSDGGRRTAQVQFAGTPEPRRYAVSGVGLRVPGPAAGAPRCRHVPAAPQQSAGEGGAVKLTAGQLRVNQRIGQAAIRRLNAVEAWLGAGVQARDLCGGAFGTAALAGGIGTATALTPLAEPSLPNPRPVTVAGASGERGGQVRLTAGQLRINQRIYQAAIRRADALEARLAGKLTGGDLAAGALSQDKLAPRLRVLTAPAAAAEPAPSRTELAARRPGSGDEVALTAAQLRINQRIGQAAVRRANALVARLEAGLTGEAFADGSITARSLAAGVVKP